MLARPHGPHAGRAKPPAVRHLILAAHSGGGAPLRRVAQVLGDAPGFKDKLKGCWGFDSIYGIKAKDADFWAGRAKGLPGASVTMHYLFTDRAVGKDPKLPVSAGNPLDRRVPTGTTPQALELERLAGELKLDNVRVVRLGKETPLDHNDVPRAPRRPPQGGALPR